MITVTGTYALRAMSYIARRPPDTFVSAQLLGEALELPVTYLGKILQALSRHQLLEGHRGRNGGYRLLETPKKITLYEVLNAVERVDRYGGCILGHADCPGNEACPMCAVWGPEIGQTKQIFMKTTVADLAWHDEQAERYRDQAAPRGRSKRRAACIGA